MYGRLIFVFFVTYFIFDVCHEQAPGELARVEVCLPSTGHLPTAKMGSHVKSLFQTAQQLNYAGTFSTLSRDAGACLGDEEVLAGTD